MSSNSELNFEKQEKKGTHKSQKLVVRSRNSGSSKIADQIRQAQREHDNFVLPKSFRAVMQQISAKPFSSSSAKSTVATLWGSVAHPSVTATSTNEGIQKTGILSDSATLQHEDLKLTSTSAPSSPSNSAKSKPKWNPPAPTNEKLPMPSTFTHYVVSSRISNLFKANEPETPLPKSKLPIPENSAIFIPPSRINHRNVTASNLPLATTMRPLPQSVEVFPTPRPENVVEKGTGRRSSLRGSETQRRGSFLSSEPTSGRSSSVVLPESTQSQYINIAYNINATSESNSTADSENIIQKLLSFNCDYRGNDMDLEAVNDAKNAITGDGSPSTTVSPSLSDIDSHAESELEAPTVHFSESEAIISVPLADSEAITTMPPIEAEAITFMEQGNSEIVNSQRHAEFVVISSEPQIKCQVTTPETYLDAESEMMTLEPKVVSEIDSLLLDMSDLYQSPWWQVVSKQQPNNFSNMLSPLQNLSSNESLANLETLCEYDYNCQAISADIANLYQSSWWKAATVPQRNYFAEEANFCTRLISKSSKSITNNEINSNFEFIDQLTDQLVQNVINIVLNELESVSVALLRAETSSAKLSAEVAYNNTTNSETSALIAVVDSRTHLDTLSQFVDKVVVDISKAVMCEHDNKLDSKVTQSIAYPIIHTYAAVSEGEVTTADISTSYVSLQSPSIGTQTEIMLESATEVNDLYFSTAQHVVESMTEISELPTIEPTTEQAINNLIKIADDMVDNLLNELKYENAFAACLAQNESFELANQISEELFRDATVNKLEVAFPAVAMSEVGVIDHMIDIIDVKIQCELRGEPEIFEEETGSTPIATSSQISDFDHKIDTMVFTILNELKDEQEYFEESTAAVSALVASSSDIEIEFADDSLIDKMVDNLINELTSEPTLFDEVSVATLISNVKKAVDADYEGLIGKAIDEDKAELTSESAFFKISAPDVSSNSSAAENFINNSIVASLLNESNGETKFIDESATVATNTDGEEGIVVVDGGMIDTEVTNTISELVNEQEFFEKSTAPGSTSQRISEVDHMIDIMVVTILNELKDEQEYFEESTAPVSALVASSSDIEIDFADDSLIDKMVDNLINELTSEPTLFDEVSVATLISNVKKAVDADYEGLIGKAIDEDKAELTSESAFFKISAPDVSSRSSAAENFINNSIVASLLNESNGETKFIDESATVATNTDGEEGIVVVDGGMIDSEVTNTINELVNEQEFFEKVGPTILCVDIYDDMIDTMNDNLTIELNCEKESFGAPILSSSVKDKFVIENKMIDTMVYDLITELKTEFEFNEESALDLSSSETVESLIYVDEMIDITIEKLIQELMCEQEFFNVSHSFISSSNIDDIVVDIVGVAASNELNISQCTFEKTNMSPYPSRSDANLEPDEHKAFSSVGISQLSELFVLHDVLKPGAITQQSTAAPKEVLSPESSVEVSLEAAVSPLQENYVENQFTPYESTIKAQMYTVFEDNAVDDSCIESEIDDDSNVDIDFAVSDDSEVFFDFDYEDTQNLPESSTLSSIIADDMPYDISHFYDCNEIERSEGDTPSSKALALEGIHSPRNSTHSMRSTSPRHYGFISRANSDSPIGTPRGGIRAESSSFARISSSFKLPCIISVSNLDSEQQVEVTDKLNSSSLFSDSSSVSSDTSNQSHQKIFQRSTQFFRDNQLRRSNPSSRIRIVSSHSTTPGRLSESSHNDASFDPPYLTNQALNDTKLDKVIATLIACDDNSTAVSTATTLSTDAEVKPQLHQIPKTALSVHIDCTPLATSFKSNKMIFEGSPQLKASQSDSTSTAPATPCTPSQSSPTIFSPKHIAKQPIEVNKSNVFNKLLSFWEKPGNEAATSKPTLLAASAVLPERSTAKRTKITERYLASFSKI